MSKPHRTTRATASRILAGIVIASVTTLTACSSPQDGSDGDAAVTATPGPGGGDASSDTSTTATESSAQPDAGAAATASASPSVAAASPTATDAAAPAVDTSQVPQSLTGLAQGLYADGQVSMTESVRKVLGDRAMDDLTTQVKVSGTTGQWKGSGVAVLTVGNDVTLAVEAPGGWQIVGGWWPSLGVDQPVLGGARHVLLLGSDARPGEAVDRSRADTIQVVGVDGEGGGGVLGIARDSWVTMPSGGKAKINAALAQAGPEGQLSTVAATTGLPIEGYLLTGFEDFTALVDALGGVTVDAPRSVEEVPAGQSTLDGPLALLYSRHRKTLPDGDFGRSLHQGIVLLGIAAQTRARGPQGLPALLSTASPHVRSNLSAAQALTLAANVYVVDPGRVGQSVAKGGFGWSDDGQSIVLLDQAAYDDFADFTDGNLD